MFDFIVDSLTMVPAADRFDAPDQADLEGMLAAMAEVPT